MAFNTRITYAHENPDDEYGPLMHEKSTDKATIWFDSRKDFELNLIIESGELPEVPEQLCFYLYHGIYWHLHYSPIFKFFKLEEDKFLIHGWIEFDKNRYINTVTLHRGTLPIGIDYFSFPADMYN